jgi:hypothetical protein
MTKRPVTDGNGTNGSAKQHLTLQGGGGGGAAGSGAGNASITDVVTLSGPGGGGGCSGSDGSDEGGFRERTQTNTMGDLLFLLDDADTDGDGKLSWEEAQASMTFRHVSRLDVLVYFVLIMLCCMQCGAGATCIARCIVHVNSSARSCGLIVTRIRSFAQARHKTDDAAWGLTRLLTGCGNGCCNVQRHRRRWEWGTFQRRIRGVQRRCYETVRRRCRLLGCKRVCA